MDDVDNNDYIQIQISASTKEKWREYAENQHHGTLTGLIKDAVNNTISDDWVLRSEGDVEIDAESLGISDIEEKIDVINDKLDRVLISDIDDALEEDIDDQERRDVEETDIIEMAAQTQDILPRCRDEDQLHRLVKASRHRDTDVRALVDNDDRWPTLGSINEIANELDVSRAAAWSAVEKVEGGSRQVRSVVIDGEQRFFIRDPSVSTPQIPEEW